MDNKRLVRVSKYLSLHLRHEPEKLGLTLQPGGWVEVETLLDACRRHSCPLTRDELNEVVANNDKKRFAFDDSGSRIRVSQGHSVEIDLQLESAVPPDVLYHGTATKSLESVLAKGLEKMARHHVHLSKTPEEARKVGARHGKPVVLVVDAAAMHKAGILFFVSANAVWLTDEVPPQYLRPLEP
jgi:putative RNA 2'-phosphotransferase